jgi:uncharacterized protein YjbI with pentapeptide repeats
MLAFADVTFANTPATLHTCTRVRHGIYGTIKVSSTGTCNAKDVLQTWVDQKYQQIMIDGRPGFETATTSYGGMDFSNMSLPAGGISGSDIGDGIADFASANFTSAGLFGGTWDRDTFQSAEFNGAVLSNSTFGSDNFSDADFSNAHLNGADFTGSDMASVTYNNTVCPNGTNSKTNIIGGLQSCAGEGGGL